MTAAEFTKTLIDETGAQISRGYAGIDESKLDYKVHEGAMSVRDMVVHLCEVYVAVKTIAAGGEHEWGSYSPPSTEWSELWNTCGSLRQEAVKAVSGDSDLALSTAGAYIICHDNYHIGQLVMTRLAIDPEWNSYVIYG